MARDAAAWLAAVILLALAAPLLPPPSAVPPRADVSPGVPAFLENAGQVPDAAIRLYGAFGGAFVAFEAGGLRWGSPAGGTGIEFVGSTAEPEGAAPGATTTFFLETGAFEARSYREVVYRGAFPGTDLVYRGAGALKYDLVVAPHADLDAVRFRAAGARAAVEGGALVVTAPSVTYREAPPVAFQAGREVACAYRLLDAAIWGFACPGRDPALPLLIDPLVQGTYLGGGAADSATAVAVGPLGEVYVAGATASPDFPLAAGPRSGTDAFVARFAPDGTWVHSVVIGGSGDDEALALALDGDGAPVIAGRTTSEDLPTTNGAADGSYGGGCEGVRCGDGFAARLDAGGDLEFLTYVGGAGFDEATGVAVEVGRVWVAGTSASPTLPVSPGTPPFGGILDAFLLRLNRQGTVILGGMYLGGSASDEAGGLALGILGNPYLAGRTSSSNFPATSGAFDATLGQAGVADAFAAKAGVDGDEVLYATYLGGSGEDAAHGIVVEPSGAAYVVGHTTSSDFPATPGALDGALDGSQGAFAAKIAPSGARLDYATYLGGQGLDAANAVAVNALGEAYLAGTTNSTDFPTRAGSFDPTWNGDAGFRDAFVAKVNDRGTFLAYSSYLGGRRDDEGRGIALAGTGEFFVVGNTESADFHATPDGASPSPAGARDGFLLRLHPNEGNRSPVARAGDDVRTYRFLQVPLDGNNSYDPDGDSLNYSWVQVSGPPATLEAANQSVATFEAAKAGEYVFELTVTDGRGGWERDVVHVTAEGREGAVEPILFVHGFVALGVVVFLLPVVLRKIRLQQAPPTPAGAEGPAEAPEAAPAPAAPPAEDDVAIRLRRLARLRDEGKISHLEYERLRNNALDDALK